MYIKRHTPWHAYTIQGFPYWSVDGRSPPSSRKFADSSTHHEEKFPL